jgi:phospholipase C
MPAPAIDHIFVLMLENRSYDSLFGLSNFAGVTPDGAPTTANGLPHGVVTNVGRTGQPYELGNRAPYFLGFDPGHEFTDVAVQLCGYGVANPDDVVADRMTLAGGVYPLLAKAAAQTGFVATYEDIGAAVSDAFSVFSPEQLPVLNFLARQFALCDNWFSSVPGPTWPNRFFATAGTSSGLDHSPSTGQITEATILNLPVFPFPNGTLFSKLPTAADWLIVHGDVSQCLSIPGIHAHLDRFVGTDTLLSRLKAGTLDAKFVFIEPTYDGINDFRNGNSMHPSGDVRRGEALVKTLYEAISASKYWAKSAFLVVFDEHGGFFDHVTPPRATPPGAPEKAALKTHNFSFDQYGVRVPALVISPFIRAGTIDHTLYDHTSILKTVDKLFGLNGQLNLSNRVRAAQDFSKVLTLTTPRTEIPACPGPVDIGRDVPSSTGAPRAKEPFVALYTHH